MNTPAAILTAALLLTASAAQARDPFPVNQVVRVAGVAAESSLNLRDGPSTSGAVIGALDSGQAGLTILECTVSGDWCRVAGARGPLGWVAAQYLSAVGGPPPPPPFDEAARLTARTATVLDAGGKATIPELPPYLIGIWDIDADACTRAESETRVVVQKNGLRIGVTSARFKNAVFRGGGYDLTTLLMQENDIPNAVPPRALYRLQPDAETLTLSGDVLTERRLRQCGQ